MSNPRDESTLSSPTLSTADQEFELSFSAGGRTQFCRVAALGASLRRYWIEGAAKDSSEPLWGYAGAANKNAGQGDVLFPWPSRIKDGRYTFEGQAHQLERNDKEGPNAIHGFARALTWRCEEKRVSFARFTTRLAAAEFGPRGYPFDVQATVEYELGTAGLICRFRAENTGRGPAPMGIGFHPYFMAGASTQATVDSARVRIPARQTLEFAQLVPTGRLISAESLGVDFRNARAIGATTINHCFTDIELEPASAELVTAGAVAPGARVSCVRFEPAQGAPIEVWADESFKYWVIYTGDAIEGPARRRALAIEPMTCATDAFNHPEWGLQIIAPAQAFAGSWGFRTRD